MKALALIAVTAVLTWLAAAGTVGKKGFDAGWKEGYIRGVSEMSTDLCAQFGTASRQSEDARTVATRLLTANAAPRTAAR
jgi:hypothetical protein